MNFTIPFIPYNMLFSALTAEIETQLVAHHFSVQTVPDVVTHCAPHAREAYFHPALVRLFPSY